MSEESMGKEASSRVKENDNDAEQHQDRDAAVKASSPSLKRPATDPPATPSSNDKKDAARHGNNNADISNKKKKRRKNKHIDEKELAVRRKIQVCCRAKDFATAIEAFDEAQSQGTRIEAQTLYNLLSLCGGIADQRMHIGTSKYAVAAGKRTETQGGESKSEQAKIPPKDTVGSSSNRDKTEDKKQEVLSDDKNGAESSSKDNQSENPTPSTVRPVSDADRRRHSSRIKEYMEDKQIPLIETCYTALLKILSKSHKKEDFQEAEELLTQAENVQQCTPRLRMYTPLLTAYCETGQSLAALKVWWRLASQQNFHITEREYRPLLQCAVMRQSATLMQHVLSSLAEDVLVPSRETIQVITDWYQSQAASSRASKEVEPAEEKQMKTLLQQIEDIQTKQIACEVPSMGPVQCEGGWTISPACTIDTATGILQSGCLQGERLKPVHISEPTWKAMRDANEKIVLSGNVRLDGNQQQVQGGGKGKKRRIDNAQEREYHWNQFKKYLRERRGREGGRPVDVLIDGANVGHFDQNFTGAPDHVSYEQIEAIVHHFETAPYCRQRSSHEDLVSKPTEEDNNNKKDKKNSILVVMHSRHFARNKMPRQYEPLIRRWIDKDMLYRTPPGMNDDWFWLHAALDAGPGTLFVTNDQLKDHHFQMLAPRSFLRWRDRHEVKFEFGATEPVDYETAEERASRLRRLRKVFLTLPDPYSRRIQRVGGGLVVPLQKRGDAYQTHGYDFASQDNDIPKEELYLCLVSRNLAAAGKSGMDSEGEEKMDAKGTGQPS